MSWAFDFVLHRLAQSQEEDRKQLDSLLHEFSERDVLLNKKDEKIKILYQNNRKLLECCHKLKLVWIIISFSWVE